MLEPLEAVEIFEKCLRRLQRLGLGCIKDDEEEEEQFDDDDDGGDGGDGGDGDGDEDKDGGDVDASNRNGSPRRDEEGFTRDEARGGSGEEEEEEEEESAGVEVRR